MAYAVKGIMRMLNVRFSEKGIQLTLEQFFILNILDNESGLILQDLADILDRDKSAVLRHIDALEEHNFVVRNTDPDDKRRKILIVTKPGLKEMERARKVDEQVHEEVTADINDKNLQELEKSVATIYKNALHAGGS
jgi:DNA-binding MarR family transcriptional regulator